MELSTPLNDLFGTEEYVCLRRQLVLLREIFLNNGGHQRKVICSGSLSEGVDFPTSHDIVISTNTAFRVVMTYREITKPGDVLMVPSDFSPGYCRLFDVRGVYPDNLIHVIDERPFVSSSLYKQIISSEGRYNHGPWQSGAVGSMTFDYASCIPCNSWPGIASTWTQRVRSHEWPSRETVQSIIHNGCHVMPHGDPDSPHADHEWRISFSLAERTLIHSFNHVQFLVYNLLRLTLNTVIVKILPDVFCSFFMKTTLFYTVENTPSQFWQVQNFRQCFKTCISVLYDYVDNMFCPNYFIPEYNVMNGKVNHTNRNQMLNLLRILHTIGIVGIIYLSGLSNSIEYTSSAPFLEYRLDRRFMLSKHLHKCIIDIVHFIDFLPRENTGNCTFYLYEFLRVMKCKPTIIKRELIDIIWKYCINKCCLKLIDQLFTTSKMNKQYYRLNKTIKALLAIGFRADVTTERLTMATYMYLVGKTKSALHVIRQLLSECPPYTIDNFRKELKVQDYIDVMCGGGFPINYKMRQTYAPRYCLNAFPPPLKTFITTMGNVQLDPLTYAYFLQCLCHARQQDPRFKESFSCLVNRLGDLKDDNDIACTKMCLGIIKYAKDDNQSALRWMGSAYAMKDSLLPPLKTQLSRSAFIYMACLLNNKFQSVT